MKLTWEELDRAATAAALGVIAMQVIGGETIGEDDADAWGRPMICKACGEQIAKDDYRPLAYVICWWTPKTAGDEDFAAGKRPQAIRKHRAFVCFRCLRARKEGGGDG